MSKTHLFYDNNWQHTYANMVASAEQAVQNAILAASAETAEQKPSEPLQQQPEAQPQLKQPAPIPIVEIPLKTKPGIANKIENLQSTEQTDS